MRGEVGWVLLGVWTLLASGGALRGVLGVEAAGLAAFLASSVLVVATRRRPRGWRLRVGSALAALASGFLGLPAWIAWVASAGLAIGLPPRAALGPVAGRPALALAVLVLAPLFEELLYRERLIPPLRARLGVPAAIAVSSALFALPHLDAWSLLGSFGVGLALGALYVASGSVAPCLGLHAGLNLAWWVCGAPPLRHCLAPRASALAAAATLMLALRLARPRAVARHG